MITCEYPCPDCHVMSNLHKEGCEFSDQRRSDIEAAYVEILSRLAITPTTKNELVKVIDGWSALHNHCLQSLESGHCVVSEQNGYRLLSEEERREAATTPQMEPLKTIYEQGSFPGCHDNSIFSLISYYEMRGFSWAKTKEQLHEWLQETGTWERGGFSESSPEELIESKRHVYEQGYGWKQKAEAAKSVIDEKSTVEAP